MVISQIYVNTSQLKDINRTSLSHENGRLFAILVLNSNQSTEKTVCFYLKDHNENIYTNYYPAAFLLQASTF